MNKFGSFLEKAVALIILAPLFLGGAFVCAIYLMSGFDLYVLGKDSAFIDVSIFGFILSFLLLAGAIYGLIVTRKSKGR